MTVRSSDQCQIQITKDGSLNPIHLLPFNIFQRKSVRIRLDHIKDVTTGTTRNDNDDEQNPPYALEIADVSFNWHKLSRPIFDVTATSISVHLVFGKEGLPVPLTSSFEIPVPSMRIGNWTVDEVIAMLLPPPEEEGLYPRLGVVSVTNVTIVSHTDDGGGDGFEANDDKTYIMPNELFHPLLSLTKEAGPGGVDQTKIPNVMREAVMIAIRKYFLGEDAILETMQKSSEFVDAFRRIIEEFIQDGGEVVDRQLSRVVNAMKEVLETLENEWNEAMNDQDSPIAKVTNELKDGWGAFKNSALFVEDLFENFEEDAWKEVKQDVEHGWEFAKEHLRSIESHVRKEVKNGHGWEFAKEHRQTLESKFESFEKHLEHAWKDAELDLEFARERLQDVRKAAEDGLGFARNRLHDMLKEGKKSKEKEL